MTGLARHFERMALNNAWSNARLLGAVAGLDHAQYTATRTSFFPSLRETLNHILLVDLYYVGGLETGRADPAVRGEMDQVSDVPALVEAQRAVDRRLLALCRGQGDGDLARAVILDRGARGLRRETRGTVLPHLFIHQIHHRGQVHAMLSGTPVAPPQLDEFFLEEDAVQRDRDLADFGLTG
ncbi:DinB family protein [Zavarzinia compransoris]|uniref:DinB family protein n=1 Tax=Zavarzinia marina TaxID=2911065 RepID=UPI001F2049DD|nr:DinB family protein [Zavarzinia marina]MCF4165721.1 DinB family protein [Zavarzinia marina]